MNFASLFLFLKFENYRKVSVMNKYIKKLKTYSLPLYWAIVFVVAAVLLYLILPGEHRFKYEYQKGFPGITKICWRLLILLF